MRLIDVDALKEYINDCEFCRQCPDKEFRCFLDCELPNCVTLRWRRVFDEQPTVQPEPIRIIPETRAIPSDDDRVSLSEKVTATYYDDEHEEWSRKIVTVRDVLDSVCDEYTVLPTSQPVVDAVRHGKWIEGKSDGHVRCTVCKKDFDWTSEAQYFNYCPNCGARMDEDETD